MRRVHWAKAKHENQEARERRIARTVDMDMGWLGRDRRLNVEHTYTSHVNKDSRGFKYTESLKGKVKTGVSNQGTRGRQSMTRHESKQKHT